MPKEVLRQAAPPAPAAAALTKPAAPTVTKAVSTTPEDPRIVEMEKRLKAMNLEPKLIVAALANERKKLGIGEPGAAASPAVAKEAAPVAQAPVITTAPATESKKVEQKAPAPAPAAPAPAAAVSDEEFAQAVAQEYAEEPAAGELPPDEALPAPTRTAPAAADVGHDEEDLPGTAMVVRNQYSDMSGGALSGPIDRSDFKTPQLKLVQGSGPLSQKFNQGTLIFMDQSLFPAPDPDKPGPPLKFIPVAIQKYFRENLQRDPVTGKGPKDAAGNDIQPRNVATFEEVEKLGGTTEFTVDRQGNRIKPTWSAAARCTVIIERPKGNDHPGFTVDIEVGGEVRTFAPAIIFVNGGQYRSFVKPIIDATAFILTEGTGAERRIILDKRVWQMQVIKEKSGENMVFNPKVTILPELTPADLREFAKSLRG